MVLERGTHSGSSWGGSISADEFRVAALAFAERWEKCNLSLSQWSWVSPKRLGVAADNVSILANIVLCIRVFGFCFLFLILTPVLFQVEGYLCLQNILISEGSKVRP